MQRSRVLVADDHPLLRQAVRDLLSNRFEVVGTAPDGQALVEMAVKFKPDIIVLDISMPVVNGLDAARQIKRRLPATKLVFLSVHSNLLYLQRAFEVGASGYVLKSDAAEQLLMAIDHVLRGDIYVSAAFDSSVIDRLRTPHSRPSRSSVELTARQKQILQYVAEGHQNKKIATELKIGTKTVEFHRARLMKKLGLHSVGQLTRFAIEEGLLGASCDGQSNEAAPIDPVISCRQHGPEESVVEKP